MENRRIRVLIETRGPVQNYEAHVARPLACIVANAFENTVEPVEQILPEQVEIEHRDDILLEEMIVVAISIDTSYDDHHIREKEALSARIAQAIHQNGMFRCRGHHEPNVKNPTSRVRLEINLGVRLPSLETA